MTYVGAAKGAVVASGNYHKIRIKLRRKNKKIR